MPEHTLLHAETTRKVVGAFYYVYNALGFGFPEPVYQRALTRVLSRTMRRVDRERPATVLFEGVDVGSFRLDLVVDDCVVVEIKAVDRFHSAHDAQLLSYLRASGLEVGLLLNFGPRAEYRRLVLSRRPDTYAAPRSSG
ncbi:MAG: GxxExxY protein [Gemmatimonadetes bacterium]|nr:GxxExxY protein [Gemmatimonadota bacterium]